MSVCVVIPVQNGAGFIAEAVDSALAQPEVDRIVVVDDGSVDDTADIVSAMTEQRIVFVSGARAGVSAARNRGFAEVDRWLDDNSWVMFLDADDRLREGAIGRLIGAATDDCVAVYGDYERIGVKGEIAGRRSWLRGRGKPSGDVLRALLAGNFIVNGGVMAIRSPAMRAIHGFDESLRYCEDWQAFCRLAALGPFRYLDEIVLDYRVHATSAMMRDPVSFQHYRDALDRVYSDPGIRSRLEPVEVQQLYSQAEAHLRVYLACQAVRSRVYLRALPEAARALRLAPRRVPGTMIRILAAAAGF
jgi:glycosyltransferase involved in cell wall biosynthesis